MTTFLFWNTKKRPLQTLIAGLVAENHVDVLALAECLVPSDVLINAVDRVEVRAMTQVIFPEDHLRVFSLLPSGAVTPIEGGYDFVCCGIKPPLGPEIVFVAVHFASALHQTPADRDHLATRFAADLRQLEQRVGHKQTVVAGDFNLDPFDAGLVSSEGLHAVMDRRIAEHEVRTIRGQKRDFFYNPMWSRFGHNAHGPPGSYFYHQSSPVSVFWHLFDQVLVRPALLSNFADTSLRVVTEVNGVSLAAPNGRPNPEIGSDHFPIAFTIDPNETLTAVTGVT